MAQWWSTGKKSSLMEMVKWYLHVSVATWLDVSSEVYMHLCLRVSHRNLGIYLCLIKNDLLNK